MRISETQIEKLRLTRLTGSEYQQISKLKQGEKFTHINLQHNDLPDNLTNNLNCAGILIKKHGVNKNGHKKKPILDYKNTIPLEQLKITPSIPVKKFINDDSSHFPNLILHNKNGMLESLFDRYGEVMGLTKEELLEMDCFITEFKRK